MKWQPTKVSAIAILAACGAIVAAGACGGGGGGGNGGATADAPKGPPLLITVSHGRDIDVNGKKYGNGQHPGKAIPVPGGKRTKVNLGPPGQVTPVTMDLKTEDGADDLALIHIDNSADSVTLVYGSYGNEMAPMSAAGTAGGLELEPAMSKASVFGLSSAAVAKGWECIWCQGEILACGVNPQCGSGGGDGDSIN